MNPLGLPFEIYNHAGYLRMRPRRRRRASRAGWDDHAGGMPDPALDGPVQDGVELSEKLADSPYVKRCFVRQTFRYFMGRAENRTTPARWRRWSRPTTDRTARSPAWSAP